MNRSLLSLMLTLLTTTQLMAQQQDNRFQYTIRAIGTQEGLPQNDVNRIMVDNNNFVWYGTNDGVGYFDGDNFQFYRAGDRGLTSSIFIDIAQDPNGNVMLLSVDKGLFIFDARREWFSPIDVGSPIKIAEIKCDKHNNMWMRSSDSKLYKLEYDPAAYDPYSAIETKVDAQKIDIDGEGELLARFNNRIYRPTHIASTVKTNLMTSPVDNYIIEGLQYIQSLCSAPDGSLYALADNKLCTIDLAAQSYTPLMGSSARSMFISKNNQMLLSTARGILYKDLNDDERRLPTLIKAGNITVTHFTEDQTGTIWAGTFRGGVIKFEPRSSLFRSQLTDSSVEVLFEDSAQNIWVGGIDGSINILKYGSSQLVNLRSNRWAKAPYMVTTICEHHFNGRIYVSAGNGIFSTKAGRQEFRTEQNMSKIRNVRSMLPDGKYMWIASYTAGLILYDVEADKEIYRIDSKHRSNTLEVNIVRSIMKDCNDNIWFGTQNGLYRIDGQKRFDPALAKAIRIEAFSDRHSLSSSYVIPIIEDHKGDIWVGTLGMGLFVLKSGSEREYADYQDVLLFDSHHMSTQDGPINNNVKSLIEDDLHNVWASTNNGIYKINTENYAMLNYGINDGLLDSEYSELASCKLSNGEVLLGNVKGFNIIDPTQMSVEPFIPSVAIVQMSISNKEIEVGESYNNNIVLNESIIYTEKIKLLHNQNSLTFKFSSPHKAPYGKIIYQYKLEGFDESWINCIDNNRSASYTNLPPHSYRFSVRTSNDGHNWSPERTIDIEIVSSIWVRWYSISLYILILTTACAISIRQYILYIRNRNRRFIAERERIRITRLTESNLEIFSNVSHELRTPLTLIITNLQRLISDYRYSKEQDDMLEQITNNSSMLLRLTNNLLDFTKQEHKNLDINLQYGNFVKFCTRIANSFNTLALTKEITYKSNITERSIHTFFDVKHMESILYNILSNAIKYTPERGEVTFEITEEGSEAVIRVSNSGKGIDEQEAKIIFNRYYSSASSLASGTGIGLTLTKSLVEMHNGTIQLENHIQDKTTFTLKFPILSCDEAVNDSPKEQETTTPEQAQFENEPLLSNKHSILIIDDNEQILTILQKLFSKEMKVYTANNATDGYKMCIAQQPSIILCDIMMPEVSGIELCRMVKDGEDSSHIPVVLLTADAVSETQAKALDVNADAFCTKPFDNKILLSTIRSIVVNREKMYEKFRDNPAMALVEKSDNDQDNTLIDNLVGYIERNAAKNDFSVEKLCIDLDISLPKLTKSIKEITGQTIIVFIKRVKLRKAAKMLASAKYTVAEATYAAGFNDLKHFRTIFKAEFGVLPNDFANKYKTKH